MSQRVDITAEVTLLPRGSGPRDGPIIGEWFGCPISINGEMFDVRFYLPSHGIELGSTSTVQGAFLSPDLVRPLIHRGTRFTLWEGGTIGEGTVMEIHGDT
jgi:hypothetical protein